MTSPKNKRTPPTRDFEQYSLYYIKGKNVGLIDIADNQMNELPVVEGYLIFYPEIDIGFNFVFNSISYKKIFVDILGYVSLIDPRIGSFQNSDIIPGGVSKINQISTNGFANNAEHVVLSPWGISLNEQNAYFGYVVRDFGPGDDNSGIITLPEATRKLYNYGFQPPSKNVTATRNQKNFGIRYVNKENSIDGKYFVIRFNSWISGDSSLYNSGQNYIQFRYEIVLYESGKIEYRYDAINPSSFTLPATRPNAPATVGIFVSGSDEKRGFRDFSYELGYRKSEQNPYVYGGSVYTSSYTDYSGSVFSANLNIRNHWPSTKETNGMFVFSPPENRIVTLPKIELNKRSNYDRYKLGNFNDQETISFVSGVVSNFPVAINRFHGGQNFRTVQRKRLFFNNAIEITGSISNSFNSEFVAEQNNDLIKPFHENNHVGNSTDVFFISGSNVRLFDNLTQPTLSKTKLTITFSPEFKTIMPEGTSSIYYYSNAQKMWLLPQRGSSSLDLKLPTITDGYLRDHKGFGPVGNFVASGSTTSLYSRQNFIDQISENYSKNITSSDVYSAISDDQTFSLDIKEPFLLEKATIEIPFEMGAGWFNDLTTQFAPMTRLTSPFTGSTPQFDFAGPALTVALMHQVNLGSTTKRNIILTGTITHTFDNVKKLVLSSFNPSVSDDNHYYLRPQGFASYANPGAVISVDSQSTPFTGSVILHCPAAVSNGAIISYVNVINSEPATNAATIRSLLSASSFDLDKIKNQLKIAYVSPIGRSKGGLDIDIRSIYGRDFITPIGSSVANPFNKSFYENSTDISSQFETVMALADFSASAIAAIPRFEHVESPYLINPNDKLILAVSKMRPFILSSSAVFSGSTSSGHEVKFNTGSINLTFYGSYIRENKEHHPSNRITSTNSVYETVIGDYPVLDQFDGEYKNSYAGSMIDEIITGSMVSIVRGTDGRPTYQTGSRGSIGSYQIARLLTRPITQDYKNNPTYSEYLQPLFEVAGTPRFTQIFSDEIYWDSQTPAFETCTKLNGSQFMIDTIATVKYILASLDSPLLDSVGEVSDVHWTKSYPFESKYSTVTRLQNKQSYTSRYLVDSGEVSPLTSGSIVINFKQESNVDFFFMDSTQTSNVGAGVPAEPTSLSSTDIQKILFGFGDLQTTTIISGSLFGTNNFVNFRAQYAIASGKNAVYSPVIRGWKYGLVNGLSTTTKMYMRNGRYGQYRDMLEQRYDTKFSQNGKIKKSPVEIRFVNQNGSLTKPENTWSSNLSFEASSSLPYFDGVVRNRNDINTNTINQGIISFNNDNNGNISL